MSATITTSRNRSSMRRVYWGCNIATFRGYFGGMCDVHMLFVVYVAESSSIRQSPDCFWQTLRTLPATN